MSKLRSENIVPRTKMFNVPISEHISYGSKSFRLIQFFLQQGNPALTNSLNNCLKSISRKLVKLWERFRVKSDELTWQDVCMSQSILIMDEPTGNLDAVTEALFEQVLMQIQALKQQTVVLIGRRLSLCPFTDQIVVEDGRVKDFGKHEQLMVSSPWYSGFSATK